MTDKEFTDKFLDTFAKNISKKELKKCHVGIKKGCLWNLFGYKLLPCFEGNKAREEYDKADKTDAIEIQYALGWYDTKETSNLSAEHNTAAGIDDSSLNEFYVVGKDFSWCYVVTHAGDAAGPYFCYAP